MPILTTPVGISCLRASWRKTRRRFPFETIAFCVLPDHLHCLWGLPEEEADFSERWRVIKSTFTRAYRRAEGREGHQDASRRRSGEAAVWQRRFWEHRIRDEEDMRKHFDYTHFNPVKHELRQWPEEWPWSSYRRYVRLGWYQGDWGHDEPPSLEGFDGPPE